jgi:hypothetical protein
MQTVVEACLAACEDRKGESAQHTALFRETLKASVSQDRQVASPSTLGYNRDHSDCVSDPFGDWHDADENIVTYNGVAY